MSTLTVETRTHSAERESLAAPARKRIAELTVRAIEQKFWDPHFDIQAWRHAVRSHLDGVLGTEDMMNFEQRLNTLVQRANEFAPVPSSDIGFMHQSSRKRPAPKGLAARFRYCEPNECSPSHTAAMESTDVLYSRLGSGVGWLKVTKFPGAVGIEVANEIDRAIAELKASGCDRLVLDLRGHASGGLAFLRVMSNLTAGRMIGGYSITRRGAEKGIAKEKLKKFDWIPSQKWQLPWLVVTHGLGDPSVQIVTEGLGPQSFHGRTVLLVDKHTTGAGERIAAFAAENNLATIIGTQTAGKLVCSDSVQVGNGYLVRVPARVWYTGKGRLLEAVGVQPDVEIDFDSKFGASGSDNQLQRAKDLLC